MGPDAHREEPDRHRRRHHHRVTEDHLPREDGDDLGDEGEARDHEDVDLGVTEEPEEVLPHDRRSAGLRVEEVSAKKAVQEQHDLGGRQRRKGNDRHAGDDEHHPDVDWHATQGHPGAAHREGRDDQVDGSRDRPEPHHENGEVPVISAVTRGECSPGERRVGEPTDVGSGAPAVQPLSPEDAEIEQEPAEQERPEPEGVQAREGQVAGSDHQRHQVVGESEHDGDSHQEHHGGPVHGEELVERPRRHDVEAGRGELQAHRRRLEAGNDQEHEPADHVHDPESLVVDRDHPVVEHRQQWAARSRAAPRRHRVCQHAHELSSLTARPRGKRSLCPGRRARASWPA